MPADPTRPADTGPQPAAARTLTQPAPSPPPDPDRLPPLAPPDRPGDLGRLGPYRVVGVLGRGGMGVVLRAEDEQLNRPVALKVMGPDVAAHPEARSRFLREARAAAAVAHDHVVPVLHVGEEGGRPYIAMPLLAGEVLSARLARGPLGPDEVVKLGREAALGLAAAHEKGLIHRDVKPANLWLEPSADPAARPGWRVRVLDFGLARAADPADRLSAPGAILGTPRYMAPEQADGQDVDARADLFSLGAVLYEAATGVPAFDGPTLTAVLMAVATHDPPPPHRLNPAVPVSVSDLIMRLLSKDPAGRPASAAAVAAEFAELGREPQVRPEPRASTRGRRSVQVGCTITVSLCLMIAFGAGLMTHHRGPGGGTGPVPQGGFRGSPAPPPSVEPLDGWLDVRVWDADGRNRPGRHLSEPGALPLRPGQWVRLEAEVSRPAYLYVVWLEASGKAVPLYPWADGDWARRPATESPRTRLTIPEQAGEAAELPTGPTGIESVLLLARSSPLPADADLAAVFAPLPKQAGETATSVVRAAWFKNGQPVADEANRSAINTGRRANVADPVEVTRQLLQGPLRERFELTRAVCFGFEGPPADPLAPPRPVHDPPEE